MNKMIIIAFIILISLVTAFEIMEIDDLIFGENESIYSIKLLLVGLLIMGTGIVIYTVMLHSPEGIYQGGGG